MVEEKNDVGNGFNCRILRCCTKIINNIEFKLCFDLFKVYNKKTYYLLV